MFSAAALFAALLSFLDGGPVWGQQQECYACKPSQEHMSATLEQQLQRQFPSLDLPICNREPPAARLCPPRYKGCLTQYHGEMVVRLCGELRITACQIANRVEYCYCEGNLCNDKEAMTWTGGSGTRDDDEDSEEEGSGSAPDGPPPEATSPPETTGAARVLFHSPYLVVFLVSIIARIH